MRELLDAAIDEIERVLIGNKDRNAEEVYLKNAIRHIREYGSQPQLNENQKLLLEDLKNIKEFHKDKNMLGLIWVLGQRITTKSNIKAFIDQEILEVLQALEQEAE